MKFLKLFLLLFVIQTQAQQGGMWIPSLLKGMNETEMKNLGMKMSVKEIYDVNNSSIKDAVPHFNGGCTSEVISPKGLILTNHHCGYSQIQSHSTVDHDYLTDGFWAYKMEDELPNENKPDKSLRFLPFCARSAITLPSKSPPKAEKTIITIVQMFLLFIYNKNLFTKNI